MRSHRTAGAWLRDRLLVQVVPFIALPGAAGLIER